MRLVSMIVTLLVLVMIIVRLQDPAVIEMIGKLLGQAPDQCRGQAAAPPAERAEPAKPSKQPGPGPQPPKAAVAAPAGLKPLPPPQSVIGPTDEDQEEAEAFQEEAQAITDHTLSILPEEMFAYSRLVQWVINQPVWAMRSRARTDVLFSDLMHSPESYRGTLLELTLNARMIRKYEDPRLLAFPLYEIWGFTSSSGAWLYCAVVVDLPEGLKIGTRIHERIRVVGYFLKLQGYYPGKARPDSRPLSAPLVIGRIAWASAAPPERHGTAWLWAWALLGAFVLLVALRFALLGLARRRRRPSPVVAGTPGATGMTVDEWFERAAAGTAPEEPPKKDDEARFSPGSGPDVE